MDDQEPRSAETNSHADGVVGEAESVTSAPELVTDAAEPSLLARFFSRGRDRDAADGAEANAGGGTTSGGNAGDGETAADDDVATSDDERAAGHGEGSDETSLLGAITDRAESAAETVGKAVTQTTATIVRGAGSLAVGAGSLAAGAARRLEERPAARARLAGRTARDPLPVLWEVHPAALNAPRRELGLVTVPLEQIRGTAVEGAQRGGDFKPIPRLRGANWQSHPPCAG